MWMSYWKPATLTAAILSLSLLNGCFHHHRYDDDDRVVVPAGYHDRDDWYRHRDWDRDRYRHDRDWDHDRY